MQLTKEAFAAKIKEEFPELSKNKAEQMYDFFWNTVKETLTDGGSVSVMGFGTFGLSEYGARVCNNPITHEKINVPACTRVKFKPGNSFSQLVKSVKPLPKAKTERNK